MKPIEFAEGPDTISLRTWLNIPQYKSDDLADAISDVIMQIVKKVTKNPEGEDVTFMTILRATVAVGGTAEEQMMIAIAIAQRRYIIEETIREAYVQGMLNDNREVDSAVDFVKDLLKNQNN